MPIPQDKSFDPILFDCIDKTLVSVLGKETIDTFYYFIKQKNGLPQSEFPKKPLQILASLKELLGEIAFRTLEKAIVSQIKETFEITESVTDISDVVSLAKRNYLKSHF